jgi:integrase
MQADAKRLTANRARALPLPAAGYALHWCPMTPGFGVRVTAAGARAWIAERRVNGKTVRRTLGKVEGRGAISVEDARADMVEVSGELQRGVDRLATQRAERAARSTADAGDALTLRRAIEDYLKGKRRAKDGKGLKDRTKADYAAMLASGGAAKNGRPYADGELSSLADKPLHKITAADVRAVHAAALERGERRAVYAMQVLRAVLNWHGVKVPDNPLGKEIAGRDRIVLGKTAGDPRPIPPERLPAWWQAACTAENRDAAEYLQFLLLTGARGGEVKGIRARDVDPVGARVLLPDTKNRKDHTVLLSKQAAAILTPRLKGKRPAEFVFDVVDPRHTLTTINEAAGVEITPHDLRATFASVAEELCSAYSVKRMLNHADAGDVTGGHYIAKSETQLRAAWQAVGDFIAGAQA